MIRVELYDLARRRAGRDRVDVEGATLREALAGVVRACPALAGELDATPPLHWRISLNGARFVEDPATPLRPGDVLLILSAQAGG